MLLPAHTTASLARDPLEKACLPPLRPCSQPERTEMAIETPAAHREWLRGCKVHAKRHHRSAPLPSSIVPAEIPADGALSSDASSLPVSSLATLCRRHVPMPHVGAAPCRTVPRWPADSDPRSDNPLRLWRVDQEPTIPLSTRSRPGPAVYRAVRCTAQASHRRGARVSRRGFWCCSGGCFGF